MNESISIIDSVELIPLEDTEINPFLTRVRIKVFHLGENRNHSFINKETAISMAKTLRGNPIVARYREEEQDFTDHGREITINDKGFSEKCLTKPYGFVDLDAKVQFEDFNDVDEKGNIIPHTYLVTEGIVQSEYYQELKNTILPNGRPQSMELDEKTLQGTWSNKINSQYEIFIINDAIITKLCALGEHTEPCFLGASITPLFSEAYKNENFVKDLLDFKTKFNLALNKDKGGSPMADEVKTEFTEENAAPEVQTEEVATEQPVEKFSAEEGNSDSEIIEKTDNITEEFAKKEEKEDSEDKEEKNADKEDTKEKSNDEEDDKKKKDFALIQEELETLKAECASLKAQNEELIAFKAAVEDEKKMDLINSFYMLSDEDKKDVIENKAKYSLDDIEAKLSVICVRKKVNFNMEESNSENEEQPPITYNLNSVEVDTLPAWLKAVENNREHK